MVQGLVEKTEDGAREAGEKVYIAADGVEFDRKWGRDSTPPLSRPGQELCVNPQRMGNSYFSASSICQPASFIKRGRAVCFKSAVVLYVLICSDKRGKRRTGHTVAIFPMIYESEV